MYLKDRGTGQDGELSGRSTPRLSLATLKLSKCLAFVHPFPTRCPMLCVRKSSPSREHKKAEQEVHRERGEIYGTRDVGQRPSGGGAKADRGEAL